MSVLLITYDLNSPGQDYSGLYKAIKQYPWCHALDSTWFIDTDNSPKDVRDALKEHLDDNDQLYVFRLRKHCAAAQSDHGTEWLKSDDRTWD